MWVHNYYKFYRNFPKTGDQIDVRLLKAEDTFGSLSRIFSNLLAMQRLSILQKVKWATTKYIVRIKLRSSIAVCQSKIFLASVGQRNRTIQELVTQKWVKRRHMHKGRAISTVSHKSESRGACLSAYSSNISDFQNETWMSEWNPTISRLANYFSSSRTQWSPVAISRRASYNIAPSKTGGMRKIERHKEIERKRETYKRKHTQTGGKR